MGYHYPQMNDKTAEYTFVGTGILGILLMLLGSSSEMQMLGVGIAVGGALIGAAVDSYQKAEGAEYIATHYSGEDAIREAMELAKSARNDSIGGWIVGGIFFLIVSAVHSLAGMAIIGLGNLANFIMIFVAHGRYSELRKMLMILQLKKSGKAEIAIKL